MTAAPPGELPLCTPGALGAEGSPAVVVASATIPTRYGPFRCVVFGPRHAASQGHVAMVRGDVAGEDVLVRIHTECMTGDVFASVDCDCASDLDLALRLIANEDRGVVVYLRGEGADGYAAATALLSELGVLGLRLLTGTETRRLSVEELDALPRAASAHPNASHAATRGAATAHAFRPYPGQTSFTADSVHSSPQHPPFLPSGVSA